MLAVIKAGCDAIALDPNFPAARLQTIVQQAKPTVITSSKRNHEKASLLGDAVIVGLDKNFLSTADSIYQLPIVLPSDLVYISFTSGTTGQPKGACMSHANVRSAVRYQSELLGFCRDSRVLDFAPYSFDVAWSNFFHTLCTGGCLCIAPEQDMLENLSLAVISVGVTLINITPTILRTVSPIPTCLQTVLLSGEMPYRENITQWADHVRLLNTYGPTECTFKSAFSILGALQTDRPDIGVGVGCCTWIVDPSDSGKLVSRDSVGELYLEGPLVGQVYLSDADNAVSAFISDPPWLRSSGTNSEGKRRRLYKTGDLVRYKPDGKLLFVGRKDASQLKVRGQRVEIGDVEHHVRICLLDQLPVIADVIQPLGATSCSLALFVETH